MMRATDVAVILDRLEAAGIPVWLDGGWGIDALLGKETRAHADLDLVVALDRRGAAEAALGGVGFAVHEDEPPTRCVLRDPDGRQVDLHTVTFDARGGGLQRLQDGTNFRYPPEGFTGTGRVDGRAVRCLSVSTQVLCHLGYPPDADDRRDLLHLAERYAISLPPPYGQMTGVVLAGGASWRMGQDKAALPLDGEPLLARVVRGLRAATPEVLVVGPAERALLVPDVRVVPDERPGLGPLGGIYSALMATPAPYIFVVACDMPFVRPEVVRYLLSLVSLAPDCAVVVPRSEHGTEQLHAVYGQACLPAIRAALDVGELAIADLYRRVSTRVVEPEDWAAYDPPGLAMRNVNTPEEWAAAQQLDALPPPGCSQAR